MQMKNFGTKFSWKSLIDIARRRIKEKAFFPVLPRVLLVKMTWDKSDQGFFGSIFGEHKQPLAIKLS